MPSDWPESESDDYCKSTKTFLKQGLKAILFIKNLYKKIKMHEVDVSVNINFVILQFQMKSPCRPTFM